jgi:3-isopropylmalate/(R)-2-methylmalate dehydratase large subunit
MPARTLYEKLWDSHLVREEPGGTALIYIDRHVVHEVTSPQAFEGLDVAHRKPWRIESVVATADHNVPTTNDRLEVGIADPISRLQVETLDMNVDKFHVKTYFGMKDKRQGIVHVIAPEQGAVLPGMTVVCGDSHTSTNGAFAALAFGIGTSEVEHVLATQTVTQKKSKSMLVKCEGALPAGRHGQGPGARDHRQDRHRGRHRLRDRVRRLDGSRPLDGRPHDHLQHGDRGGRARRHGRRGRHHHRLPARPSLCAPGRDVREGGGLLEDARFRSGVKFDKVVEIDSTKLRPQVTWGTSPEMVVSVEDRVPDPDREKDPGKREAMERALEYMGLEPNKAITDIYVDKIFIGSCTNSRIEDLRAAAAVVRGKRVAKNVKLALVVPGLGTGEGPGREGRSRPHLPGFRLRVARRGLLHVPGHERRQALARGALRLDLEPQFRGPPGRGRTHAPREPADGRRRRDRGSLRGHSPPVIH